MYYEYLKLYFFQNLLKWTNALEIFTFTSSPDLLDSCTYHARLLFLWFLAHCLCALVFHLFCNIVLFIFPKRRRRMYYEYLG